MNKYLKELGIKAELNDLIERTEFVNGKRNVTFIKKYELITTHTARRSFATNLFKQGFPSLSIMKITGHKTETAFIKYVKVTTEQSADLLAKFWSQTIK
jgi:site-specific recombinase XerD